MNGTSAARAESETAPRPKARRPWYWFVALVVIAGAATLYTVTGGIGRVRAMRAHFAADQMLRLQNVGLKAGDFFNSTRKLCDLGAAFSGGAGTDRRLIRRLMAETYLARENSSIYGLGAFFLPGEAGTSTLLFSDYVRAADPRLHFSADRNIGVPGVIEELYETNRRGGVDDYVATHWFGRGLRALGSTTFVGPYVDHGRTFISAERAIVRSGRIVGVMSVDALVTHIVGLLNSDVAPGDVVWVESSGDLQRFGTVAPASESRVVRTLDLAYPRGVRIYLSADARALEASARWTAAYIGAAVIAIWIFAGLAGMLLMQRWRTLQQQRQFEGEQQRYEREIAVARAVEAKLRTVAFTDSLTGLPNRAAFIEHVNTIVKNGSAPHTVFFIDLDRFNMINKKLGHLAGDEVLKTVAAQLERGLPGDTVVRLGGDEFVVLAAVGTEEAAARAELMLEIVRRPIASHGQTTYLDACIGAVGFERRYADALDWVRDADIALFEAKRCGPGCFALFDEAMHRRIAEEAELESDLRRACGSGEIVAFFQPIVSTMTRRIVAFEALARWRRRDGTIASAADFVLFAERRGFIAEIDRCVFEDVCAKAAAVFGRFPEATISANLSAAEIARPLLTKEIQAAIDRYDVAPERLRLEITETAMMGVSEEAYETVRQIRRLGVEFVLDDFGTGYSSLAYLQRLPVAGLKIDRSFVREIPGEPKALEIIRSIVALAKSFGLSTTAEGVETAEQFRTLAALDVDYAQGFYFSPAVDSETLIGLEVGTYQGLGRNSEDD